MIPLKFYRDDEYVYYNNPNGITKKMTIADFEAVFNADASELPTYTSSDGGKVLTVNSGGTGLEWSEESSDIPTYDSGDSGKILTVNSDGTGLEWGESGGGNTSLLLSVKYTGEAGTIAQYNTFSFFDVEFLDALTWETVDIATLDYDYCVLINASLPNGCCMVSFSLPDNDAYLSFGLTVRNTIDTTVSIQSNIEIAYIKLINPRPASTPSEPVI